MSLPKVGNLAPSFSLLDQHGKKHSLKDYRGKKIVLYFYPKAMTPGCTVQAQGLRDIKNKLDKLNVVAIGVSIDSSVRLAKFEEKHDLNFVLLSDEDHAIANKYGSWGPKKFMGKEYDGILRQTFLIDEDGRLKNIITKVKTKDHHNQVLEAINEFLV